MMSHILAARARARQAFESFHPATDSRREVRAHARELHRVRRCLKTGWSNAMDAKLIYGLVVLFAVACVALVAVARARRGDGRMIVQTRAMPHMQSSFGDAHTRIGVGLGRELLPLLEAGEKAQAVRLLRERAGLDAAEAEAAVERLDGLRKRLEL
jgi:hypothetical protein